MNAAKKQQVVTIYKSRKNDGQFEIGGYFCSLEDRDGWTIEKADYLLPDGFRLGETIDGEACIVAPDGQVCDLVDYNGNSPTIVGDSAVGMIKLQRA